MRKKVFDCPGLFSEHVHDLAGSSYMSEVPKKVSNRVLDAFSYNRRVEIRFEYKPFDLEPEPDWEEEEIDGYIKKLRNRGTKK